VIFGQYHSIPEKVSLQDRAVATTECQ